MRCRKWQPYLTYFSGIGVKLDPTDMYFRALFVINWEFNIHSIFVLVLHTAIVCFGLLLSITNLSKAFFCIIPPERERENRLVSNSSERQICLVKMTVKRE